MRALINRVVGAMRRPLMIDQLGFARQMRSTLDRELGYVENTANYAATASETLWLALPPIWLDGKTAIRLEIYLANMSAINNFTADFRLIPYDNGVSWGFASRNYYIACCGPLFAGGTFDFHTPTRGWHTFHVNGIGNGGSITRTGGPAPSYLRCVATRLR